MVLSTVQMATMLDSRVGGYCSGPGTVIRFPGPRMTHRPGAWLGAMAMAGVGLAGAGSGAGARSVSSVLYTVGAIMYILTRLCT